MANIAEDLQNIGAVAAGNTFGTAVSGSGGLTAVDLVNDGANRISGLLTSTAVAGAGTASIQIQESADNSTWTDVAGALFTTISAANAQQLLSWNQTKRYVRGNCTITGTSVTLQLSYFYTAKTRPSNTGGWVNEVYSNV